MDLFTTEEELSASAYLSAFAPCYGEYEDGGDIPVVDPSTLSIMASESVTINNEYQQPLDVAQPGFESMPSDDSPFLGHGSTQFVDPIPMNNGQQRSCAYEQGLPGYPINGHIHQQAQDWTQLSSCAYQQAIPGYPENGDNLQQAHDWTQLSSCAYQQAGNSVLTDNIVYHQDSFGGDHSYNSCRSSQSASPPVTFHIQYPDSSTTKKRKRFRTAFTTYQILELEDLYRRNNYLDRPSRLRLAERMQLHERAIKIWFQNRRMKEKKQEAGEI